MDTPEVRRRVRAAIEQARRDAAARRERSTVAARDYEEFLATRAIPAFSTLAAALVAEGHRFKVFTPAGSVRLASERSPDDFIELLLDSSEDPPVVLGRTSLSRGRRSVTRERPIRDRAAVADLTDEDVVSFVITELTPFVERSGALKGDSQG
jgi:hypothetical protein